MQALRFAAAAAAVILLAGTAAAQTTLRIGLAEDPDILDPTLARTYVGRIVFASLCDKLFDFDVLVDVEQLIAQRREWQSRPAARHRLRDFVRRQGSADQTARGRSVPRRREVRRRGGEILARA